MSAQESDIAQTWERTYAPSAHGRLVVRAVVVLLGGLAPAALVAFGDGLHYRDGHEAARKAREAEDIVCAVGVREQDAVCDQCIVIKQISLFLSVRTQHRAELFRVAYCCKGTTHQRALPK